MRGRFVSTESVNVPGDFMKVSLRTLSGLVIALCLAALPIRSPAQAPPAVQRITTAIDNQNLTVLHGNVHPLAKAESDQGAVADAQVLHRMLLLLQRSPEQESALQQLLSDQQSKSSGRFQGWLTPEQFGAKFGPSDADVQTVTQWLAAQGFSNVVVGAGRTTVEFSGTAGTVRNAFHTEIRRYTANGETHFANASDPAVPVALAPVVAGVVSLNNFPIRSHLQRLGTFETSRKTGETRPLFTITGCAGGGGNCYGVGPADFAKIYNSQPLLSASPKIDGSGQGIAVVGESNIHVQDVTDFRTMFGLEQNSSASNVIVNGEDPGITDSEDESDLDVQWAGAVAPGARVDFVTSASTETTAGINLSAIYIVDHNLDAVMSESFGACEKTNGTTLNQFLNSLWEQASAQGITVVVSAGDSGSAGCDDFTTAQTATQGLAVSGFASTPYNVAVGGTDFDQANNISTYWNTVPTSTTTEPIPASAKSYIPEIPWNDTCAQLGLSGCTAANVDGISAGSGGVSTLYAKPSWQAGTGVPADGHRDVPDVSLFAGNGFNGSFYIICQSDATQVPNCNLNAFQTTFQGVGGTSASAPAFAGIMALVNQKLATGSNPAPRQGNANPFLYALAQQQVTANLSCNSSSSPVATCSFNDVTKGNNDVPCTGASTNCSSKVVSTPGVLVPAATPATPAYTTTAGYDLATGLGSLNVQNIVNKWSSVNTTTSTTTLTLNSGAAVNITHGQPVPYLISVGPATASGDASLVATPTGKTTGIGPFPLTGGAASGTTTELPGGTSYNVVAHYEGNGTDAPSNSPPVTVTVAAEPSNVFITVPTFNPENGQQTGTSPTTLVYGSPYILRADVTNATGSLSSLCKPPSCPSGTITFADTVGGVNQGAPNSGTFSLNSSGYGEDLTVQFPGGTNVISATYSGDGSFSAPTQATTYTLVVTPAPTQTATTLPQTALVTVATDISPVLTTNVLTGAPPTGSFSIFDGGTQLPGTVKFETAAGNGTVPASATGDLLVTFQTSGAHSITSNYSGNASYAASTSPAKVVQVYWPTTLTATSSASSVTYGQSVQVTAMVTTPAKSPAITGSFEVQNTSLSFSGTSGTDSNGNQTFAATFSVTPGANGNIPLAYSGDGNFAASTFVVPVSVTIPDFSIVPSSSTLTVTASQLQATTTVTVTPLSSAPSTVVLSCNAPIDFEVATCAFAPSSVTLSGGQPATATLTFTVNGTGTSSPNATKANVKRRAALIPWSNSDEWGPGWVAAALAMLVLSLLPGVWTNRKLRLTVAASAVVALAVACGGGSSSGSGGSGGPGNSNPTPVAVPTTTTLTLAGPEVPQGQAIRATATITSTNSAAGSVQFFATNAGLLGYAPVSNGKASTSFPLQYVGVYPIYAEYSGDSLDEASKSAIVTATSTGTDSFGFSGTTATLVHSVPMTISVQ
jgi:pro-kumamolisin-like protein/Big-like domain-containing protein